MVDGQKKSASILSGTKWEGLAAAWASEYPDIKMPEVIQFDNDDWQDIQLLGCDGVVYMCYCPYGPEEYPNAKEAQCLNEIGGYGPDGPGYYDTDNSHPFLRWIFIGDNLADVVAHLHLMNDAE